MITIVLFQLSHLEEDQIMLVHHLLTEHHRQELVERDVLDQSGCDVTGFLRGNWDLIQLSSNKYACEPHLEDGLVVPVRIDLAQLSSDPVVFPDEESVDHGQDGLLVDSGVSGQETIDILAW